MATDYLHDPTGRRFAAADCKGKKLPEQFRKILDNRDYMKMAAPRFFAGSCLAENPQSCR